MKCPFTVPVLAGVIVLPALPLSAQDTTTNQTTRLKEVVVTATRTAEPVEKTAASVAVITSTEIETKKFNTLADALQSVPGLVVARNGAPGQATSVFLRGTESNHTLLTVDGRRVPSMLAGGYDWGNFALDNVERIEVVRSSNGALYGGDAIGGVVNIITKTGRGLKTPEHETSFEGGSFSSFRETVASRGAVGMFNYSIAASQFNAEFPRDNNDYRHTSVRGSFGYEATDKLYFDVKLAYSQSDGGSPGSTLFGTDLTSHFKREVAHISPGMTWEISDKLGTKLFYTFENQFQPSLDFGDINRLNVASHLVDWQNNLELRDNWKATLGVSYQEQAVDRTTTSFGVNGINANAATLAGYGQSHLSLFEHLSIINAFRFDAYSDYKSAFTWRQGVTYAWPAAGSTIFANVSRSVSPPTPQDLYFESDHPPFPPFDPGFKFAGNPNLRPEDARGIEVGVRQKAANDKIEVTATYFRNKLRDAIAFVSRPYPTASTSENINRALMEGFEGTVNYHPAANLTLAGSYTYLTTRDESTGLRLLRRPRHQVGLDAVGKPLDKLTLSAGASWIVERQDAGNVPIGDIFLMRASAAYQICKNAQLWVRGENLLDQKYEALQGFPALRLGAYGGVKLTF